MPVDPSLPPTDEGSRPVVPTAADPPVLLKEDATVFGLPQAMFVKGGTTSMAHDRMVAEQEADAERRRSVQDAERQAASLPIEDGGGKLYSNNLSGNAGVSPKVLLRYLTQGGEERYESGDRLECLADIMVGLDPLKPAELTLILVCPRCKTQKPQGQCQIQVRQSNRRWELDPRTQGEPILFEGSVYVSAGMVMESERFSCPDCGWAARIDKNRVRPVR
jgi:hypothetical protein